jgi:hypothetical protein
MTISLPIGLTLIALILALSAYRGIRRGGARFYTLEREAILRRASVSLIISIVLFVASVGVLVYDRQQSAADQLEVVENGVSATVTPEELLETFPPTDTPEPTADPDVPTATPTAIICRAVVQGTSGSGLTLRETPGGTEVVVLPEGEIVFLIEAEPVVQEDITWRQVRTVGQREGWVAETFLTISDECR